MRSIVVLLMTTGLIAATPAVASAKDSSVARAKKLFSKAEQHFAKEEFREALDLYKQAYDAKPLPGFHFNIAQCHRSLGEYEQAIKHFELYLAESNNPSNKEDAERLLKLTREALEKQQQEQAAEEAPPPQSAPVVTPEPQPKPQPKQGRRRFKPIYFWSGVGVTAALLLTGTITGAMALSKSSEFKDSSTAYDKLQDLKDSGESLRTASSVTFGLGIAAAAGTAALYFFTDFGGKEKAVAASPVPGGAVVSMGGRF